MFEADTLPSPWVKHCNNLDEVWVPSQWQADTFAHAAWTKPSSMWYTRQWTSTFLTRRLFVRLRSPARASAVSVAEVFHLPLRLQAGGAQGVAALMSLRDGVHRRQRMLALRTYGHKHKKLKGDLATPPPSTVSYYLRQAVLPSRKGKDWPHFRRVDVAHPWRGHLAVRLGRRLCPADAR